MIMKRSSLLICFLLAFLALFGQEMPTWLDADFREIKYPSSIYFIGFSYSIVEQGKNLTECVEHTKTDAQVDLSKKIRLRTETRTETNVLAQSVNGQYNEKETFLSNTQTLTDAEIVGVKTETYFDKKTNTVYAFAYANKYDLSDYYKNNLSLNINQIENLLQTAKNLESANEKGKARQQLEQIKPLFAKVYSAQDLLTAINTNIAAEDLQQIKTGQLYNTFSQMQAQLAQSTFVYMESSDITANKVKAELAQSGCSFVENIEKADFRLTLQISVRETISDNSYGFAFCYADATVKLYDVKKQKVVYSDTISEKGGADTLTKAEKKAKNNLAPKIAEKLKVFIQ